MHKIVKIYTLYGIDPNGEARFINRFASRHRLQNAIIGLGLRHYFYEEEAREDKYGGYININAGLNAR